MINDIDTEEIVNYVVGSNGDLALAAERLSKKYTDGHGNIKGYDIEARVAAFDMPTSDNLAGRLRTLLVIKLFHLIDVATNQLMFDISELKPADLARTHASLVNSFTSLTAPATKVTFDFESELRKITEEFPDLPIEDLRGEIKEMESKIKLKKAS